MTGRPHALVYHAGGLGDFILSLPALLRLREARPELRWCLWGPAERLALLPGWDCAPPELLKSGHTLWGSCPDPAARAAVREAGDLVVFGAEPPPWLPWAAPRGRFVATYPVSDPQWVPAHQGRQLDRHGVPRPGTSVLRRWRQAVLPADEPRWLLIHPGSGDPKKNLPAPTWAEAVRHLTKDSSLEPRVLAGPVEQERGDDLALSGVGVSPCGGLGELLALLGRTGWFLGNDSGVTHLAGALGVPTVAVFGPTDPAVWRPLGPRVIVVRPDRSCAPCCTRPPISCTDPQCLSALRPAAVVVAARSVLSGNR